jgi:lipopolysaccharide/colanic/teichoic acid biosynthesis glycosyltransferase
MGHAFAQRLTDIVLASLGLVVSSPLQILVGALIAAESPGPVILRQQRIGRGGSTFTLYKFRTMHVDAADRFPELCAHEYTPEQIDTVCFKFPYDPRLTRLGRQLRRASLDELPNLVNVLKGDMTLVGPRPEIREMLRYYRPDQLLRFAVKPGLTGLAQITGRDMLTFQETIEADLRFVAERSYRLELRILARTVRVVLGRVGAV